MTKLTNAMRKAIADRIISRVAPVRETALRQRESALAVRIIRNRYGDDVFERCRSLPEGWLNWHKNIYFEYQLVQFLPRMRERSPVPYRGRYAETVYPSGHVELSDHAPLPNSVAGTWKREDIGDPLFEELIELYQAKVDARKDISLLRQQIDATLKSFTTVEKLAVDWPEGYAELPQDMLVPVVEGLPAPRIADLNERIERAKAA